MGWNYPARRAVTAYRRSAVDDATFPFPAALTSHLYCRSRGRASVCQRPHPSSHRAGRQKASSSAAGSDCHWSAGPAGNKSVRLQQIKRLCIMAYMLNANARAHLRHTNPGCNYQLRTQIYLHRVADETEGGCVSGTRVIRASAIQQAVEHPSLFTGPVTGPTAEEWMGAVVEEDNRYSSFSDREKGILGAIIKLCNVPGSPENILKGI